MLATYILIAVFLVGLALITVVANRRYFLGAAKKSQYNLPAAPHPVSLFELDAAFSRPLEIEESARRAEQHRVEVLRRAKSGDYLVLCETADEWRAGGKRELYDAALDAAASDDEQLLPLIAFIRRNSELRTNAKLVRLYRQAVWEITPNAQTTGELLHLAGLSDDADVFAETLDKIAAAWRAEKLTNLSVVNLCELVETHFWTLSPTARNTGAGFWLKRRMSNLRPLLGSKR